MDDDMQQHKCIHNLLKDLPLNDFQSSTSFVMVLNRNAPIETKYWLVSLLKNNYFDLSIVSESKKVELHSEDLTLLISCPETILQEKAKYVYKQLKKQYLDEFSGTLNTAEKQRILYDLIQKICSPNRTSVIGLPDITLYPGQSIVEICCCKNIILDYFPLHDHNHLRNLRSNYCEYFGNNIEYVRNYFGEMVGFYFAFLNYYRDMFFVASFVYLVCYLFQIPYELYTLMLCFGAFMFIKMWKRHSKKLSFDWGTIDLVELEKARPAFRSKEMHIDPISKELVPYYPIMKTWFKEYFISVPFVLICLYFSFKLMCLYFDSEEWMTAYYDADPSYLTFSLCFIPSILYALIVMILNHLYIMVATKLNNYENHKTQESHENHLIVKLVLFEFFNNFVSLFYIAFYIKDMDMLRYNLITMLTINKSIENLLEVFIPMFLIYRKNPRSNPISIFQEKSSWKKQIMNEKYLFSYENTYYDCLELFIQFGYTFLFVAIWPWAPLVAYINSVLEVRMDAVKLCYCKRRTFQKSMKSINNAWIKSFEVLSIVIVVSNFMVLEIISDKVKNLSIFFELSTFKLIVYAEHIFLTIVLIFWYIVPDVSKDVYSKLNRRKYLQLSEISGNDKKIN